ncbi:MAG: phage tail fiber protein [Planctomycetota bacterium]|jgi:hypothetical protein
MAALSDYAEQRILNFLFNNDSDTFTAPATWVELYTATPTDTGGGTAVTAGSGYARQRVYASTATNTVKWVTAGDTTTPSGAKHVDNAATITFPQATFAWGNVKAVGIFDASAAGNLLWHGTLDATKTVGAGDTFKFTTSSLKASLA